MTIALVLTIVIWFTAEPLLVLVNTPKELLSMGRCYIVGCVPLFAYNALNGVYTALVDIPKLLAEFKHDKDESVFDGKLLGTMLKFAVPSALQDTCKDFDEIKSIFCSFFTDFSYTRGLKQCIAICKFQYSDCELVERIAENPINALPQRG